MTGKRKLFEVVGAGVQAPVLPKGGLIDGTGGGARQGVRVWLMLIFGLVAAMIVVGGMTRLTDSGLSITEWNPIHGAIPPLNAADWAEEFAKYQASPEYLLQNSAMTLQEFKGIFWWEWGHRQLGRVIGLVWALGFFGFMAARQIPRGWTTRLLALGALGGLQGAIGWWMVSSGLQGQRVDVASYRLAVHLGLAFVIFGLIASYVLQLGRSETDLMQARRAGDAGLRSWTTALVGLAFVQILLGALVAGIDAGRGFPTWPDMNGQFFPADAFYVPGGGAWRALFENPGLVQFNHRLVGYVLFLVGVAAWVKSRRSPHGSTRGAFHAVLLMLVVQVALGIFTALSAATVHVAITHQIGAIVLWVLILRARHLAIMPVAGSIREGKL